MIYRTILTASVIMLVMSTMSLPALAQSTRDAANGGARLIERIKLELVRHPAFNEDIYTVSGQPHGNAPYAGYSVYIWLRQQIRRSLNQSGPDPVGRAIDAQWRVVRENDMLRLNP